MSPLERATRLPALAGRYGLRYEIQGA